MAFAQEKQGKLGHLESKSKVELEELLARQEKIALNETFLKKLPDKGAKIKAMVAKLKTLIDLCEKVDETADLFEQMSFRAEQSRSQRWVTPGEDREGEEGAMDPLRLIMNRRESNKMVVDERQAGESATMGSEKDTLAAKEQEENIRKTETKEEKGLSDMQKAAGDGPKFINSYERVIRKAEQRPRKDKFMPNRSIKTRDIHELAEKLQTVQLKSPNNTNKTGETSGGSVSMESTHPAFRDVVSMHDPNAPGKADAADQKEQETQENTNSGSTSEPSASETASKAASKPESTGGIAKERREIPLLPGDPHDLHGSRRLKYTYDECLETSTYGSSLKHEAAKMVSVEDSVILIRDQKERNDALHVKMAAERLAQRLNIRMTTWDPEGGRGNRYREVRDQDSDEDDADEDEDEEEMDYPD